MGCRRWSPDFAFTSILGPRDIKDIELLEMKGPEEKLLNYHRNHPGIITDEIKKIGQGMVPRAGVEPARPYGQRILSPVKVAQPDLTKRYKPVFTRLAVVKVSLRLVTYQHVPPPS